MIITRMGQGATEFRIARENWDGESPLEVSWEIDNGLQTVAKTFYPPFTTVDREEDYRIAWEEFERRMGEEGFSQRRGGRRGKKENKKPFANFACFARDNMSRGIILKD